MPTRGSISKRGKGPIRAEAGPDVNANHAPIQISRGAGVTLVVASLLGLAFVGWKGPRLRFQSAKRPELRFRALLSDGVPDMCFEWTASG
jgi:hypothetical protein